MPKSCANTFAESSLPTLRADDDFHILDSRFIIFRVQRYKNICKYTNFSQFICINKKKVVIL